MKCDRRWWMDGALDAAIADYSAGTAASQRRDRYAEMAQGFAEHLDREHDLARTGYRVVVVVTPEDGEFVGVGSNTSGEDVQAILACAVLGEDRVDATQPPLARPPAYVGMGGVNWPSFELEEIYKSANARIKR